MHKDETPEGFDPPEEKKLRAPSPTEYEQESLEWQGPE